MWEKKVVRLGLRQEIVGDEPVAVEIVSYSSCRCEIKAVKTAVMVVVVVVVVKRGKVGKFPETRKQVRK
jgi:hypothetical protein